MIRSQRIFAFHLLNDWSGSPKVLSQIIRNWVQEGREVNLYTSSYQKGFLSNIEGIRYHKGWYRFQKNPWLRLVFYSISQIILILKVWNKLEKNDLIYINTVLPFGAALIGKMRGCRIIYHIHESSISPAPLKWFLFQIVSKCANDIINVSQYVENSHAIRNVANHLIFNAIENQFLTNRLPKITSTNPKNLLMVCSLKAYKGVFEFIQLAQSYSKLDFRLVLNAPQSEVDDFFKNDVLPKNLIIYSSQENLHPFYQWSDVILNLSHPDRWIETFGLTIIEGMAYGLPAIVPPIGGILEVIEVGITGYAADSRDFIQLSKTLDELLSPINYARMSGAAIERLQLFKESTLTTQVGKIIDNA